MPILLCLAACVHPAIGEFNAWEKTEMPRAEKGEIKWSDFYKEAFSKIEKAPIVSNRASSMARYNLMIQASQLFEQGALSKEDFEYMQRTQAAEAAAERQAAREAASRAMGQALKNYGNTVYGPDAIKSRQIPTIPMPIYQAPKQLRCITNNNITNCQEY